MRSHKFWIPSPAVFKRDLFFKLGGYNESFGEYTDFFLYTMMAFESGVCFIPETICASRIHENQFSRNVKIKERQNSWKSFFKLLSTGKFKKYKKPFRKSHLLYLFETPVFYYLLRNPKFWSFTDYGLWKRLFSVWKRQKVQPFLKKITSKKTTAKEV